MPIEIARTVARWCGERAERARRRSWTRTARTLARVALRLDDRSLVARQALALSACDGDDYRAVLAALHRTRSPRCYLEIGVQSGETLALANAETVSIGVDPEPRVDRALGPRTVVASETSDEFFRRWRGRPDLSGRTIDLAFIDGLHLFEQALRDFLHVEERSDPGGVIVLHDVLPMDRCTAARERDPDWWTGDVWKVIPALRRHRPDLRLLLAKASPTGLLIVSGLSPNSATLRTSFDQIVADLIGRDFAWLAREIRPELGQAARTADQVIEALRESSAAAPRGC